MSKHKPEPTRVEGGAPDDINIVPADPAPSETPRADEDANDDGPLAGMQVDRAEFRLPLPPEMWSPVPTLEEPLDIDQLSRVEALKAARVVLQTSSGIFGGSSTGSHDVDDLIRIARFITTGQDPRPQQ